MFQIEDSWEYTLGSDVLRSITEAPGLRQYPLVEIAANTRIFHVDLLLKGEGAELRLWSRFLCYSLSTVVDLVSQNEAQDATVSIQTQRHEGGRYDIIEIAEIGEGIDADNRHFYFCKTKNGDISTDDYAVNSLSELSSTRVILRKEFT